MDFLRLGGGMGIYETGDAGESSSGLFVVRVAFESENEEDSAVMKVSCETSEVEGESLLRSSKFVASRKEDASGISMGGSVGILGKSICWSLVVMLQRA